MQNTEQRLNFSRNTNHLHLLAIRNTTYNNIKLENNRQPFSLFCCNLQPLSLFSRIGALVNPGVLNNITAMNSPLTAYDAINSLLLTSISQVYTFSISQLVINIGIRNIINFCTPKHKNVCFINHTYIEFKGGGAKDMSFTLYSFQCLNDKEIVFIFRCKQNSVQTL